MKKYLILIVFFFFPSFSVFAIQGDCSSHWGINCDAGADWDGSVICNDGWRDSKDSYIDAVMCEDSDTDPLGWFDVFGRTTAKAMQTLGGFYYEGAHSLELNAFDVNISHDAFRDSADELLQYGETMYQLILNQVIDARENALEGIKIFSIDQEWERGSIEEDFSSFKFWINAYRQLFITSVENAVKKHNEIIGQKKSSKTQEMTDKELDELLYGLQSEKTYSLENLKFKTINDLKIFAKKTKKGSYLLLWKSDKSDIITECNIKITDNKGVNIKPIVQKSKLALFKPSQNSPYSFEFSCKGKKEDYTASFWAE